MTDYILIFVLVALAAFLLVRQIRRSLKGQSSSCCGSSGQSSCCSREAPASDEPGCSSDHDCSSDCGCPSDCKSTSGKS